MRQEGKKLPPGKFVTIQKDNLIAMKYGIKVNHHYIRYQEMHYMI